MLKLKVWQETISANRKTMLKRDGDRKPVVKSETRSEHMTETEREGKMKLQMKKENENRIGNGKLTTESKTFSQKVKKNKKNC